LWRATYGLHCLRREGKESSGPMEIGDTQAVIIQTLTARGYGKPEM
jgi:hypothetical protein